MRVKSSQYNELQQKMEAFDTLQGKLEDAVSVYNEKAHDLWVDCKIEELISDMADLHHEISMILDEVTEEMDDFTEQMDEKDKEIPAEDEEFMSDWRDFSRIAQLQEFGVENSPQEVEVIYLEVSSQDIPEQAN